MLLEHGYGDQFGFVRREIAALVGGLRSREQLLAKCDVIAAAQAAARGPRGAARRPGRLGLAALRPGPRMTQLAIDRRLTLIALEAMNHWTRDGAFVLHVFHKNNELAGYCSVLHACSCRASPATTAAG